MARAVAVAGVTERSGAISQPICASKERAPRSAGV
jgi:hypothetical protein